MIARTLLAFDRQSVRQYDRDGRLHVAMSNISKATVDGYYGYEVPGGEALGLDPDKLYKFLRDPEELAKAAPTFNNLQVLSEHIPVDADEPQKDLTVGSTGTDAHFENGYLRNSAVIWDAEAIADIESDEKKEWSSGYYWKPDMTPGQFNGLRYDGVMRDIVGNHVALVDAGRAGPDVVVGDRKPEPVTMKLISRRAILLHGALSAIIAPKLAMDAKVDFSPALAKVTAKTRGKDGATIAANVVKLVKGKLAQDEAVDVEDVVKLIAAIDGTAAADPAPAMDDDMPPPDEDPADGMVNDADGEMVSKIMAFLEGKLSDEDMAALGELVGGGAPEPDADNVAEDDEAMPHATKEKPAMDAAAVRKAALREFSAIRDAERAVAPHIGEVTVAMDSAADVYKLALDAAGVDLTGVPRSAYRAMVALLPKPSDGAPAPRMATDRRSAETDFAARFPEAGRLIAS